MRDEYDLRGELKGEIAALRSKVAKLETAEKDHKRVQDALRKTIDTYRRNTNSTSYIPSFLWFPRI